MKRTVMMLAGLALAGMTVQGGDVNVVLDSTNGASAFRVLDQVSNAVLDVQSGTVLRLGRFQQPALDQQQWNFSDDLYLDSQTGKVWQSFTVGMNGRLSRIVWWNNYYGMNVDTGLIRIRTGEGDAGAILWSKVVTWNEYSPPIDVDSNIVVGIGDILTIEVLSIGEALLPGYGGGNPYAGGRSSESPDIDFMFETYVTPGESNPTMVSIPTGNLGVGTEPTPSSERLTVAGNIVATGSVSAASFTGNGAGLTNIGSASLADGAVTAGKLSNGAVSSSKIAAGAVQGSNLATFAVTSNKILWGEVHTEALADGAVTAAKIAGGAVGYAALADHSVASVKIASNAVGPAELSDNAVESRALASASVGTPALKNDAVTTAKLTNNAVTGDKLADGACLTELANNDGSGSGLDADLLDGLDSGAFPRIQAGGLIPAGTNFTILPPHFVPFTLQLASESPNIGGVAYVYGFENDSSVSITFHAFNGVSGTITNGGANGVYSGGAELLQFGYAGSPSVRYILRCRSGQAGLELSTTNSSKGAYYRLIY